MKVFETVGVTEAAEILQVHNNTVFALIADGSIPAAKVGRAYVMMKIDILNYVEGQILNQTAERLAAKGRCFRRPRRPTLSRAA